MEPLLRQSRLGGDLFVGNTKRSWIGRIAVAVLVFGGIGAYRVYSDHRAAANLAASHIATGTCFEYTTPLDGSTVPSVTSIPCANQHNAQVIGHTTLPDSSYPDPSTLDQEAQAACATMQASNVDTGRVQGGDGISLAWFYPNADAYDNGNHILTCLIRSDSDFFGDALVPGTPTGSDS